MKAEFPQRREALRNFDFSEIVKLSPDELMRLQKTRGLVLWIVGFVVRAVLRVCGCRPKDFRGICKYYEIGRGWGGVSFGGFFIVGENSDDLLKCHELGHIVQNAGVGGIEMPMLCAASSVRYLWRKISGAKSYYESWWFEKQATELGLAYLGNIIDKISQ